MTVVRLGQLIAYGNPAPLILGLAGKVALPRLGFAGQTLAVAMLATELFGGDAAPLAGAALGSSLPNASATKPEDPMEPLFGILGRDHLIELAGLLGVKADINATTDDIRSAIEVELSIKTKNWFRHQFHRIREERTTYLDVLRAVAEDLEIQVSPESDVEALESRIVARVLHDTVEKMGEADQQLVLERLSAYSGIKVNPALIASGGGLGAVIVGSFAGFGPYLAASSALGAITGGLGITASFGVYTAMSSALGVILGPIGIGAIAAAFVATLSRATPRKAIPAVVYIAMLRAKLAVPPVIEEEVAKARRLKWWAVAAGAILLMSLGALIGWAVFG
jgi:uncharacterized protein YaaW (UPF0174 family)